MMNKVLSVTNDNKWKNIVGDVYNTGLDMYDRWGQYGMIQILPDLERISTNKHSLYREVFSLGIITGVLLDQVTFSFDSSWDPITTPFSNFLTSDTVNDIVTGAGYGTMGSVYTSKLYWKQSGYIKLSPKFRVFDMMGDGHAVDVAREAMKYAAAVGTTTIGEQLVKRLPAEVQEKINDTHNNIKETINTHADSSSPEGEVANAGRNYIDGLGDLFALKDTPPPVSVKISNVFHRSDLVVTGVECTYSKEYTKAGPIYVDISMSLQSRTIISDYNDQGINDSSMVINSSNIQYE